MQQLRHYEVKFTNPPANVQSMEGVEKLEWYFERGNKLLGAIAEWLEGNPRYASGVRIVEEEQLYGVGSVTMWATADAAQALRDAQFPEVSDIVKDSVLSYGLPGAELARG